LATLNAETFNRCFQGAEQKENPFYIFNFNHIFSQFMPLLYAIVAVNIVAK
jgi:hypothetical protein